MKKTNTMRVGVLLLALTLITSCFVGGTFAKYTTSATGTDRARVAYWGWDQAASINIDLFASDYNNVNTAGEVDGTSKLIAPGTSNSATFAFGYTNYKTNEIEAPEVAYTFTVTPTIAGDYDSLDSNKSFKWTLKKGEETATEYNTVADLLAAIKLLSGHESGSKDYEANQLPDAFTSADEVYTIGWKWEFDGNDVADTTMGNSQTLENVEFTLTITATQKD